MTPTFGSIDKLTFAISKKVDFEDIKIGDIVEFKMPDNAWDWENEDYEDRYVVHRAIGFTNEGEIITYGDGNDMVDYWTVSPEDYRGRIDFVFTKKGIVSEKNLTPEFIKNRMENNFEEEIKEFQVFYRFSWRVEVTESGLKRTLDFKPES